MVFGFVFQSLQNLLRSVKSTIMGDSSNKTDSIANVIVPPIPKLGDAHMYWMWRMLIKAYLSAIGLWNKNLPKECAHTKFVILSTLEVWVLRKEYEDMTCRSIFEDLESRYRSTAIQRRSEECFI
ncbi:uncharacterized protein LOC108102241 [Drosophila ficusphila]|uniref:uncharacterized protein LOC108102241 n=1 Tax=Drosophila ficusphila TaxID=30025 RepID=UPI0007E64047|nr:uncharacterized protein LOC108102241 [Drosophila ficusphila]